MAGRSLEDTRRWMAEGTGLFEAALARVGDDAVTGPSALPGWTRGHVVAHVAANAEALRNLAHWARTGEETPMYTSPEQRGADIESGATRPAGELRLWALSSAKHLEEDLGALDQDQWAREVRTAQGRIVPASEVPWMRSREVMVHAVDLGTGLHFGDLRADFLTALVDDIVTKRSADPTGPALVLTADESGQTWTLPGTGTPTPVRGPLAGIAAYLAGRDPHEAVDAGGHTAPPLPRWL